MVDVLQRPFWNGQPLHQGDWFRLHKERDGRPLEAVCQYWTHQFGWELRLVIGGELVQSQVCRTEPEVFDTFEAWQAALREKGWGSSRIPKPTAS